MIEPGPEADADLARVGGAGNLDAAIVGALVMLVLWPITRLLRRRRHR